MKWKRETAEDRYRRRLDWHKWFAWYPVRVGGQVVWLETIERSVDRVATEMEDPGHCVWVDAPKYRIASCG